MTTTTTADSAVLALDCQGLTFAFKEGAEPVLEGINLELKRGDRCLLIGANGGASDLRRVSKNNQLTLLQPASRPSFASSQASASPRLATVAFSARMCS